MFFGGGSNFHIIIGAEGIVVSLFRHGKVKKRIFLPDMESPKLQLVSGLFSRYPKTKVHFYIDDLSQHYVVNNIPPVSALYLNGIVKRKLVKEISDTPIKAALRLGRSEVGKKDWIYIFIASQYYPPTSTWIEFFEQFNNPCSGISFLSIETSMMLKYLRPEGTVKKSFLQKIGSIFRREKNEEAIWDIIIMRTKSTGYRQLGYKNGVICFSRVLTDITNDDPVVTMNILYSEINKSIEYLSRLAFTEEDKLFIHIIMEDAQIESMKSMSFRYGSIVLHTPESILNSMSIKDSSYKDPKVFIEPILLHLFEKSGRKDHVSFTEFMRRRYTFTLFSTIFSYFLRLIALGSFVLAIYYTWKFRGERNALLEVRESVREVKESLEKTEKEKKLLEEKFSNKIEAEKVDKLLDIYKFVYSGKPSPYSMIKKLQGIDRSYLTLKRFVWNNYRNYYLDEDKAIVLGGKGIFSGADITLLFYHDVSYTEDNTRYQKLTSYINKEFNDADVYLSGLPSAFKLNEERKTSSITLNISYKNEKKEVE